MFPHVQRRTNALQLFKTLDRNFQRPSSFTGLLLKPLSSLPTLSSRSKAPLMFPGDFPPQERTCPICWVTPVCHTS